MWLAPSNIILLVKVAVRLVPKTIANALSIILHHSTSSVYYIMTPNSRRKKTLITIYTQALWGVLPCYRYTHTSIYEYRGRKKLYDSFQAIDVKNMIPIDKNACFLVFHPLERNIIKHPISIPE